MSDDEKFQRGLETRRRLVGEHAARTSYIQRLAPDMERWIVENLFGDVFNRPTIPPKYRSLLVLVLQAAGGHHRQLHAHVGGALNNGATPEEIIEALLQMFWYVGLSTTSTALSITEEVFRERGLLDENGLLRPSETK